jgi:hypothetical protein
LQRIISFITVLFLMIGNTFLASCESRPSTESASFSTKVPDGSKAVAISLRIQELMSNGEVASPGDPAIGLDFICDDLTFKNREGITIRGKAHCGSSTAKACSDDGEVGCVANSAFKAANTSTIASKVLLGEVMAGVNGIVQPKPINCSSDGEQNCVVDGVKFKAAKLDSFSSSDLRYSMQVAGVRGKVKPCSVDGETECIALGPSLAAARLDGAAGKIVSGERLAGILGAGASVPRKCTSDNDSNCLATVQFPAVAKVNISPGLIKVSSVIAGILGDYPSSNHPLAANTGTTDLTMFQSQLTTDGTFEFFDSAGQRYTGSGDSDLTAANIRMGIAIESLSIIGTMPAVLPSPPATLTAMFQTTPDRTSLSWTPVIEATGYILIASPGREVTFVPTQNQIYTAGPQGLDTVLYVGPDLSFVHNGHQTDTSFHYALYSHDANHFYSALPSTAFSASQLCQGLAGGSWVAVPADATYGTHDFCIQKFEAKDVAGVPTSQVALDPWFTITQTAATAACRSLGANYDIITNAEWLTIGTNIVQVPSNWSSGIVGVGVVNRGHSDNNPAMACPASSDDALAWVQTDCTPKDSGGDAWTQKRTHTLTTGAVVWDLSGNVYDWTSYVITNNGLKPFSAADGGPVSPWRDFTAINSSFSALTREELTPTRAQKPFWNDSWPSSAYGLGQYLGGVPGVGGALRRGASRLDGPGAGIFSVHLQGDSTASFTNLGFRCVFHPSSF